MKGQDFYNAFKDLFEQQQRKESSIDFDEVLETAGGEDEITPSQSSNELNEFVVDPTLFSLLRHYNENSDDHNNKARRPPLQTQIDDFLATSTTTTTTTTTTKKPQAKDVAPQRILEDPSLDEHDETDDGIPRHVSKYRALASTSDPSISRSNNNNDTATPSAAHPSPISTSNDNDTFTADPSPVSNNNNNNNDTTTSRQHPDIPATSIAKKFMAMASQLDRSPLRTIKKSHLMDIPPRIRHQLNYVQTSDLNDRRHVSTSTTTDTSSPSPALSILSPTTTTTEGDLIFTFSIYQALKPTKKLQEFHVLGSQTLTALRDALFCRMDFSAHGDRWNNEPQGTVINTFRQKKSASYFYIDQTFYVDQRLDAEDLSGSIRQWLKGAERKVVPMDAVRLDQLVLQLNTPYLFDHQQHCQHVVMLRDIRLLESRDKHQVDQYPIVTYSWRYRRLKCNMCMIYPAVFVTTNDYLSGFSPCFFCERCYAPFHFDKCGKPVTTFDVCAYHGT